MNEEELSDSFLYLSEPDYQRPLLRLGRDQLKRFYEKLFQFYGRSDAADLMDELVRELMVHAAYRRTQADASGRSSREAGPSLILEFRGRKMPFRTWNRVMGGLDRALPRGQLLLWFHSRLDEDRLSELRKTGCDLMGNADLFSVPAEDEWLREYLAGNPRFRDFFFAFASPPDLAEADAFLPCEHREGVHFARFHALPGERWILADAQTGQALLNLKNPQVLFQVVRRMLFLVRRGVSWIHPGKASRLWKERESAGQGGDGGVLGILGMILETAAPEARIFLTGEREESSPDRGNGADAYLNLVEEKDLATSLRQAGISGDPQALNRWVQGRYLSGGEGSRYRLFSRPRAEAVSAKSAGKAGESSLFTFCSLSILLSIVPVLEGRSLLFRRMADGENLRKLMEWLSAGVLRPVGDSRAVLRVLDLHPRLFSLLRQDDGACAAALLVVNPGNSPVSGVVSDSESSLPEGEWKELDSDRSFFVPGEIRIQLKPFQAAWYIITASQKENDDS